MVTPPGHNSVGLAGTLVRSICAHLHGDRVKSVSSKKQVAQNGVFDMYTIDNSCQCNILFSLSIFDLIKIKRMKDLHESVVLCLVIYVVVLCAQQRC